MSRLEGALCFMVYCARFDWRFALDARMAIWSSPSATTCP